MYRRHTNFSIESIEQTFNGTVDFGRKVSCTVSRNGDLIHKVYLQVDLPALTGAHYIDNVGHFLIDEVSVEIGGQLIDRHFGDWLNVWNQLTQAEEKADGYSEMINPAKSGANTLASTLYIPLQFWFCKNPGLALPLIALQYHEVKFNITFAAAADLSDAESAPSITNASLYVDYIYLDTDERRQFAQVQHSSSVLKSEHQKCLLVTVY